MQRQRGGLVPIGDALSGLGGPMKAIRDDSPQARRGFTVADQVHQLVSASEADADLGFMARCAACPAPTPATGFSTSASTGHSRSTWSRAAATSSPSATFPGS